MAFPELTNVNVETGSPSQDQIAFRDYFRHVSLGHYGALEGCGS